MSTFTEIKNNYLTYISENYRDDNGNVDLQYDPDISTFIEI